MMNKKSVDIVERELHSRKIRKAKGITLVALIVTIIILLILAGISIASLTGNGLFEKAKLAKEKQENAQIKEDKTLGDYENKIGEYINGNREDYKEQIVKLEEKIKQLESEIEEKNTTILSLQNRKLTFLKKSETLRADTLTAQSTDIQLDSGSYVIVGITKTAEWGARFTLSGDDNIKEISSLNGFWYWPSDTNSVSTYRQGRGSTQCCVFSVTLKETKTLTGSLITVTDGSAYMTAGSLYTNGGFLVYKVN